MATRTIQITNGNAPTTTVAQTTDSVDFKSMDNAYTVSGLGGILKNVPEKSISVSAGGTSSPAYEVNGNKGTHSYTISPGGLAATVPQIIID